MRIALSEDVHASEAAALFQTRQYRAAAAVCLELLARDPDDVQLRILRARALMALRCDDEAKRELSRALRVDRRSGEAHRLLGELAIRCGKLEAAATLLRHALRHAPGDTLAASLLELLACSSSVLRRPGATAPPRAPDPPDLGAQPEVVPAVGSGDIRVSLARERQTARPGALRVGPHVVRATTIQPTAAVEKLPAATAAVGCSSSAARPRLAIGSHSEDDQVTAPARARFGRYLVDIGALTPMQLRAALDYHKRAGVRVGAAAVALGFMSEPRVEWAAHDFHARVAG